MNSSNKERINKYTAVFKFINNQFVLLSLNISITFISNIYNLLKLINDRTSMLY